MNPNRGETPSQLESAPAVNQEGGEILDEKRLEKAARPETSAKQLSSPVIPVSIPDATPVNIPSPLDDATLSPPTTSDVHSDKIEKQWVNRAKAIVDQTKDDPFKQKNEMSKVKSDYIKQRFNKTTGTDTGVL